MYIIVSFYYFCFYQKPIKKSFLKKKEKLSQRQDEGRISKSADLMCILLSFILFLSNILPRACLLFGKIKLQIKFR